MRPSIWIARSSRSLCSTGVTPGRPGDRQGLRVPARRSTTLANQLEAAHLSWKGYMEDMGNNPRRESATCGHPPIGAPDNTQRGRDRGPVRHAAQPLRLFSRHYRHVPAAPPRGQLGSPRLRPASRSPRPPTTCSSCPICATTPTTAPAGGRCVDGAPGGLIAADRFLSQLVPKILASPAFRRDGLLIITFDESDLDGNPGPPHRRHGAERRCRRLLQRAARPEHPALQPRARWVPGRK